MADAPDRLITTIPKNAREEFRLQLRTFKGHRNLDFRVFADNGVERVATGKGVSIKPASLPDVIRALQEAEAAARAEGLLP